METKNSIINRAMAAEIKGERTALGLSTKELADISGVPEGTLNRMSSSDIRDINITQMESIAKAFGLTLVELVAKADQRAERMTAAMSDATSSNDLDMKRRQRSAALMSTEQLEGDAGIGRAAVVDQELDTDEDDQT